MQQKLRNLTQSGQSNISVIRRLEIGPRLSPIEYKHSDDYVAAECAHHQDQRNRNVINLFFFLLHFFFIVDHFALDVVALKVSQVLYVGFRLGLDHFFRLLMAEVGAGIAENASVQESVDLAENA